MTSVWYYSVGTYTNRRSESHSAFNGGDRHSNGWKETKAEKGEGTLVRLRDKGDREHEGDGGLNWWELITGQQRIS